jgi:hypothetical protein
MGYILRLGAAACLFLIATTISAQNATSVAITGTVTDPANAVVVGAKVTVTNLATGLTHTTITTGTGFYTEESLPPGDYSVTVNAKSFKTTTITNVHLDPGQRRGLDLKLTVGSEAATVSVTADAVVVQTESAEAGGTITAAEVQNLMLNGRNFSALLTVVPGVSSVNGANQSYQAGQGAITSYVVVNGSSSEETMYTIDGVYNDTSSSDITLPITPVVDQIEEMRVLSDNYSARYGLAGRQVLVTTKSGGEQYHGSGYFFDRTNEYGSARNYLSGPLTSLHLSDWGITLGGPVEIPKLLEHKKLFFFVGADWKALHQSYTSGARNVFTTANRTGDLSSEPANAAGANLTPYASLSSAYKGILDTRYGGGAGSGVNCITQKGGTGNYNQILPKCMDSNTVLLMNAYWPTPNYNLTATTTSQNYMNDNPTKFSVNDELYRGDYSPNANNTITFRVMKEEAVQINATRGYNDYAPNPNSATDTPATNALLRWQSTFKPSLINNASVGLIYTKYYSMLIGQYTLPSGVAINQKFPGVDPLNRIPDISMNNDGNSSENWFWLGGGALPTHSNSATTEVSDDLTWVKGNHVFQGGFTYMRNLLHANSGSAFPMGNFCFDGSYSGDTAGDYLMGFLASGSHACSGYGYEQTNLQRDGNFRNNWTEAYFQDDWKVTPKLTLNLGLRWSYFSAPTKDGNDISNFVPSAFSSSSAPAICEYSSGSGCAVSSYGFLSTTWQYLNSTNQPLEKDNATAANITSNGMVVAGTTVPAGFTTPHKGLFAPRIGFAYRLTNDGKTSIHGGFGFGYTQVGLLQTSNLLSNIPYVQTPVYFNTEFTNPAVPTGQTSGGAIPNPPGLLGVNATANSYRPATIRNYSLTVEKEVAPGGVLSLGYVGMTTQHIFTTGWDQNFPLNGTSSGDAACIAQGAANAVNGGGILSQPASGFQFDPCLNATGSAYGVTAVPVNSYYYRPYQGYSSMGTGSSFGVANYNGLLVGYVQKMRNLTAHVSYTFSKALGDVNASGVQVAYSSSGGFQNSNNPMGDYGRPDYDRPNVFVDSLVYDIPFFNKSTNLIERSLLGGWSLSSYMVDESGFAVTPTYSSGLATRPNQVGPLIRAHGTDGKKGQNALYQASAFSRPGYGFFGNASVGSLRAPKEVAIHMSAEKAFAYGDRFSAKIGAQAFNVLNHPNVMGINATWSPTTTTFGAATSYGDPRLMQFYAKIIF